MEKINVAEILKDCPSKMELDCTICNGVKFIKLNINSSFPIVVRANNGYEFTLTKYGQVHNINDAKCVIFPKGKTTWEGFIPLKPKFKCGDVVACDSLDGNSQLFIFKEYDDNNDTVCYLFLDIDGTLDIDEFAWKTHRLATEEEKEKLFQAIKDNGYKWNPETKTLEKLPKFKVGDRVKHISVYASGIVVKVSDKGYYIDYPKGEGVCFISFTLEKQYELAPDKFDITTLKPFESKVLVRSTNRGIWCPAIYGFTYSDRYYTIGSLYWKQCIPYEGNEHLLGTTNDCDEYYKTWE